FLRCESYGHRVATLKSPGDVKVAAESPGPYGPPGPAGLARSGGEGEVAHGQMHQLVDQGQAEQEELPEEEHQDVRDHEEELGRQAKQLHLTGGHLNHPVRQVGKGGITGLFMSTTIIADCESAITGCGQVRGNAVADVEGIQRRLGAAK
ncbi:unnamed protein product, partial [Gongylonema pulchrum]|uniref:KH_dom_type_1 domain-containing protein n=1 Tax=Gongylonema pulchrum TaxID=637853 RepID=A0A183ELD4_9BILA